MLRNNRELWLAFLAAVMITGIYFASKLHIRMVEIDPNDKCRMCHARYHTQAARLTALEGLQFPPLNIAFMVGREVTFGYDFDHNKLTFRLRDKYITVPCLYCYIQLDKVTGLQITGQDCFSCHQVDDPHEETLGTDCTSCHSTSGWRPPKFDHNSFDFKPDGSHLSVVCTKCHVDSVFKGTSTACVACYLTTEIHQGQFGEVCSHCHTVSGLEAAVFYHSRTSSIVELPRGVHCAKRQDWADTVLFFVL